MANVKLVDRYRLPAWFDLADERGGMVSYRKHAVFAGMDDGKPVEVTLLGVNPFEDKTVFSIGGFDIRLTRPVDAPAPASGEIIASVRTSVSRDYGVGVREYDVTKMMADEDTLVLEVAKRNLGNDSDTIQPDVLRFREATAKELEYANIVEDYGLSFLSDQEDEVNKIKSSKEYKEKQKKLQADMDEFNRMKEGM